MKIGILTFHDGPNHGAFLQAYSLMSFLRDNGHDVHVINYKNKKHWWMEEVLPITRFRKPIRFIDFFGKKRAFKKAHKMFSLSKLITSPEELKNEKFDLVIFGSDVVWNIKIFGFDPVFYGDLNTKYRVSYAPSFGWTSLEDDIPGQAIDLLKSFNNISVRDINSQKIVTELTGQEPPIVLDPTLIYKFPKTDNSEKWKNGKYILVYNYHSSPKAFEQISTYCQENGLVTLATGYRNKWCDYNKINVGPFEWIEYYQNASRIATSTFHGVIFSIKCEQPFFYINNEKAKFRVASLFRICGIDVDLDVEDGTVINIEPDYEQVNRNLSEEVDKSRNWLLKAIEDCKI